MGEGLRPSSFTALRHPQSFEACLFCALLNGGDRDTLGTMACAVSGAYLGLEAIPQAWQEKIKNRKYIEGLALKLVEMHEKQKLSGIFGGTHD
ncbi:MAG: ADP-ribosylglycohydrolase family protein [Anaerolineae bacterium]